MRFRTSLVVTTVSLLTAVLVALVVAISHVVDRAARERLHEELARTRSVVQQLWDFRDAIQRAEGRRIAGDPRLRAVVATSDISHATVLGVARDLRRAMEADVFTLVDSEGRLLADTSHPEQSGESLLHLPGVATAFDEGSASAVWLSDRDAYQVHAHRVAFGDTVVGAVVVGRKIDDRFAQAVLDQTGSAVAVIRDRTVVAVAWDDQDALPDAKALGAALGEIEGSATPSLLGLGAHRYLATSGVLQGKGGEQGKLSYIVSRSLDRALSPSRKLIQFLYVIGAIALLVAAGASILLARQLSRPLDRLVAFTSGVGAGDMSTRAPEVGPRETRTLALAMNNMVRELDASREQLAAKERLEREMEIAERLQLSMLPDEPSVPGLEIAARMIPASEVGGDYYDVIPVHGGGSWIGIGDVAGHGLPAGVVMLMVQTAVSVIVAENPCAGPDEVVSKLNDVLYSNLRNRLKVDEHVTLTLLRHAGQGRFSHAGAHEDIIVYRAAEKRCERITTRGTWIGIVSDVRRVTERRTFEIGEDDVMVVLTDGITEAANERGDLFGYSGVVELLEAFEGIEQASAADVLEQLMRAVDDFLVDQNDDITALVVRRC